MSKKLFLVETIKNGRRDSLQVEARSRFEALHKAKERVDGQIIKITERQASLFDFKQISKLKRIFEKKSVKQEALITAMRQMSVMSGAGLAFTVVLKEAIDGSEDRALKAILTQNLADINAGVSLSASAKKFEKELTKTSVAMIELGERTGAMAESLDRLSWMLEQSADNREKIRKALRYPMFVGMAMVVAFGVLVMGIVPRFKSVFDRFHAELPLPTRILIETERFLSSYSLFAAVLSIALALALKKAYATNGTFRLKIDEIILKIPITGKITKLGLTSRFATIFKELIKAGVPIAEALEVSSKGVDNAKLRARIEQTIASVQKGAPFALSLRESGIFDGIALQMISAGEHSGALALMMEKTANYYQRKFETEMDDLTSAIEPILIAVIAGFVLLLALGVFMPMWDMAGAIG